MRRYVFSAGVLFATMLSLGAAPAGAQALADDQLPITFLQTATPGTISGNSVAAGGVLGHRSTGGVLGVDSLANWSSYFYEPGLDTNGFLQFSWPYTMVGRSPFAQDDDTDHHDDDWFGHTTRIPAPIVPVTLDLRNADGSPRFVNGQPLVMPANPFVAPVLQSPVFDETVFSSSATPTQYGDAVQRAEFFKSAPGSWHTALTPRIARTRTMTLIRGSYSFALNSDGTCCAFVLVNENAFVNALFPSTPTDTTTVMGAAENAHDITTKDLATFLFKDTYLFEGTTSNCCILGFHSYDLEPGDAGNGFRERRYVMDYASWISPGLFRGGLADVTALSHEVSETFNDPFVNNVVPWWLSPNGNCQNDLEVGDVIEGLPDGIFPITMNGRTYHPQNEALVQWFAGVSPSNAIDHAYSYPDETVLTSPNVPQQPKCTAPAFTATAKQ